MRISLKKTEAMRVNVSSPTKIRIRGQDISHTNKFTYLGSVFCQDGGTSVDTKQMEQSKKCFYELKISVEVSKLQHKDKA